MSTQAHPTGEETREETRSQAVARRLRGKLAENRISGAELARRLNTTQALISRRTAGHVAFELDELDEIEKVTGISADYLWSGRE